MIQLLAIRTVYSQWAAKSGIHQYLGYLDSRLFNISQKRVPLGDDIFPLKGRGLRDLVKRMLRRFSHNRIYDLNDFTAEMGVYVRACAGNIDIIQYFDPEHTLSFLPALINKPLFFPRRRKPVIIGMFHQPRGVLKELVSPQIARQLDHVILMSSEQKEFFADILPDEKLSVILHGIDTDYYCPDQRNKAGKVFKCVTVGHWLRDYETLQQVAERLRGHPVEFHVVSSANIDRAPSNIIFHRGISDEALLDLYRAADLLFMPLKDATANNAILEGIACGLPVLTTDLSSTREYLMNTDTIFVLDNEVDIFGNHILELAGDREKCIRFGKSSRQRAIDLSWPNVAEQYGKLYSTLIKER